MGLLDNFFADSPDDPRYAANMNLFAGMIAGNLPQGLTGYANALNEGKQQALKNQLVQAQLRNYDSEIEARKLAAIKDARQQKLIESLLGPSQSTSQGGGEPSVGQPAGVGAAPPQAAGGLIERARALGIPEDAIKADIVFNGGKKISEFLEKRGTPDMQVSNGYAYDKNKLGAGYLPQLNTSQDGKTSMVQIGPDGLPVVSAPRGAQNTYAGYRNIDESAKANFDPVTVTPQGQNPQMTSRGNLMRNPLLQGQIDPQVQAGRDAEATAIKQSELAKAQAALKAALTAGDQSAAGRAQGDIAALQRELGRGAPTVGMPLQSEEEKLRGKTGVEGDAKTNEARAKDVQTAQKFLSVANQVEKVLDAGPTASGIGSMIDSGAAFFGKATPGSIAAQQLTALGGWMVANVPRMEGPQSNFDVGNYQRMAADVGNQMLPLARRKAALQSIKEMMQNTINSGGAPGSGGATGDWSSPSTSTGGWSATLKK